MSLVAYGSSDEGSDGSDTEDTGPANSISVDRESQNRFSSTSRETNDINVVKPGSSLKLPAPRFSEAHDNKNPGQDMKPSFPTSRVGPITSLGPDPVPLNAVTFAGVGMGEDSEEILAIEDYTPLRKEPKTNKDAEKKPKSVGGMFSSLPAPWKSSMGEAKEATVRSSASGKAKNLVKIAVPSAPKADSDDEMDCEPAVKKPRASQKGSGLSSLLPKPKHSVVVKTDNPNKPSLKLANRPLIPHTLTRKTAPKKDTKMVKKNPDEEEYVSDEDEPVSFFTFQDKSKETAKESSTEEKPNDLGKIKSDTSAETSSSHEVLGPSHIVQSAPELTPSSSIGGVDYRIEHHSPPPTTSSEHQGLCGSSVSLDADETYYYGQQGTQGQQYETTSAAQYSSYPTYDQSSSSVTAPYYNYNPGGYNQGYPADGVEANTATQQDAIDVQQLKRLQGRKNRGEEINIVEVNAADQMSDPSHIAIRQRSEELAPRPSMKKGNMPSSQQRRKHQITYLAFQAKEREHELRQQWAANSQTRRQTQSKYGF